MGIVFVCMVLAYQIGLDETPRGYVWEILRTRSFGDCNIDLDGYKQIDKGGVSQSFTEQGYDNELLQCISMQHTPRCRERVDDIDWRDGIEITAFIYARMNVPISDISCK